MQNVMVVFDGTEASRVLYESIDREIKANSLDANAIRFDIERDSESGLCSGSGISEFRGKIDHLAQHVTDVDLLLVHLAPVSREIIAAAPKLRMIGSERSSLPNIDLRAAKERGISVSYAAGRNTETVAEFTVGLMLDVTRSISSSSHLIKRGQWTRQLDRKPYTGVELFQKRIGLFGLGSIGKRVAQLLNSFGAEVVYYDPYFADVWENAKPVSRDELLATSDLLSVHARSEAEQCLIFAQDFKRMKDGAYFINTARGYLVDEDALVGALQSGKLRGAALDVYQQEPLCASSPLLSMENVVLCPHLGGLSQDMNPRSAQFIVEDTIHFLKGEPLVHAYRG